MPAELLALTDGPSILLDKPILLFGRDLECDIRFDSRKISRRHCCLAQVGDALVIRDLGSTNGVRINGERVVEGYLKAGDELTIGNHRYQVRWDSASGVPSRPAKADKPPPTPAPEKRKAPTSDDEILESCDEPVPLIEPPHKSPSPERGPDQEVPLPLEDDSLSGILPEQIDLVPGSEERPYHLRPPSDP